MASLSGGPDGAAPCRRTADRAARLDDQATRLLATPPHPAITMPRHLIAFTLCAVVTSIGALPHPTPDTQIKNDRDRPAGQLFTLTLAPLDTPGQ